MRYWPSRVNEKCQEDPSLSVAHSCFWRYHPERAWAWELRLQQEIGPDFRIEEPPYRPGGRDLGDAMPSDVSDTDVGSDGSGADETDDDDERPVRTGKPAGNDEEEEEGEEDEEEEEDEEDEDDFRTAKSGRSRRSHKSRRTRRTQQDREGADARSRASMSSWVTAADLEHGRAGGAHDSASYADRSELAGEAAEGGNPLGFLGSALGYLLGLQAAEDSEYDAAADDDGRASRASLSQSVSSAHSLNY